MADPRNGELLLSRGGGEQGSRTAEQNPVHGSVSQLLQKVGAQHDGAAAAAGAAGVDILCLRVKDQIAAVAEPVPGRDALPGQQRLQGLQTDPAQVSGDDPVIVLRGGVEVLQMGPDCVTGCRSHGGAHVARVGDPEVRDGSDGGGGDKNRGRGRGSR